MSPDTQAAQLIANAFGAAMAEGTKLAAQNALGAFGPIPAIALGTAALGTVIESFSDTILKSLIPILQEQDEQRRLQKDALAKLDAILIEPLKSAQSTLRDVVQIEVTAPDTQTEIDRQLDIAYDNLKKALSYAETDDRYPEAMPIIVAYLALVATLKRGGADFARLHIQRLRQYAQALCAERDDLQRRSQALENDAARQHRLMEISDESDFWMPDSGVSPGSRVAALHARTAQNLRQESIRLSEEAKQLEQVPETIDAFCEFLSSRLHASEPTS